MIKLASITKKLSTAVVAVVILGFMCTVGVLTVIKNRDTLFSTAPELGDAKARITLAFNENVTGFDKFISIYSTAQKLMGTAVFDDAGYTYIIRDDENNFHLHTKPQDATPYAEAVAEMRDALEAVGVPLLYISAPTKEMDGYTNYPPGISYATVKNDEGMSEALDLLGVSHIDLSAVFREMGTAPETMFYRTDHHWTTETAFAANAYVMEKLTSDYGFAIDPEMWDTDNFSAETQKNCFLGSIGRRVGSEAAGFDDYTFLEPKFETEFQVYYPREDENSKIYPTWAGDFRASFVREGVLYSPDTSANRYASYFEYDFGHLIIKNLKCDNDVRIAIVKDSFALPFTAFMSCSVSEIDMIDLREFEGSVTDYLTETKPDIVLILYSGGSFSDIMYEFDE